MFRRFLGLDRAQPATPDCRSATRAAPLPGLGGRDRDGPPDRRPARGAAARGGPLPRLLRLRDEPDRERRLRHQRRGDRASWSGSPSSTAGSTTPQAVLVVQMAKVQARVKGGTEDFVVTREFRVDLDAGAAAGAPPLLLRGRGGRRHDHAPRRPRTINEIARELDLEAADINAVRDEFHEQLSAVQALRRAAAVGPDGAVASRAARSVVAVGEAVSPPNVTLNVAFAPGGERRRRAVARRRVDRRPERVVDLDDVGHVVGGRRRAVRRSSRRSSTSTRVGAEAVPADGEQPRRRRRRTCSSP